MDRAWQRRRVWLIAAAAAVAVHVLALGLVHWVQADPPERALVVSVSLQPAPPLPMPSEETSLPRSQGASPASSSPGPESVSIPLPDLPSGDLAAAGGGASGGGLGPVQGNRDGPMIEIGPLHLPASRVIFMVDTSSSMRGALGSGTLADAAADLVCRAIKGLPLSVRYRLMLFSSELAEPLGSTWRWKADADAACDALAQAARNPRGLTRSRSLFDEGGLLESRCDCVVLVTDGGILDLEAGALQAWLESAPSVRLDVVLLDPSTRITPQQRRLKALAQHTGGALHRLHGGLP
ncbi:MAG: VWA domain-containing protein [Phycisphaerales bacterium]|nr:VWA domain-containing protein [Phycisphaerales bacterium]